jgi:hypothetical protein
MWKAHAGKGGGRRTQATRAISDQPGHLPALSQVIAGGQPILRILWRADDASSPGAQACGSATNGANSASVCGDAWKTTQASDEAADTAAPSGSTAAARRGKAACTATRATAHAATAPCAFGPGCRTSDRGCSAAATSIATATAADRASS